MSAPAPVASRITVCSFRTLLPPPPNDSRSSRFISSVGHDGPSAACRCRKRSTGVACCASSTIDVDMKAENAVAMLGEYSTPSAPSASLHEYTEWMSGPLVAALEREPSLVSVELRPPRAELDAAAGMEAWIDTHHAVRSLVKDDKFVFLTDSAVGARE